MVTPLWLCTRCCHGSHNQTGHHVAQREDYTDQLVQQISAAAQDSSGMHKPTPRVH